MQQSKLIIKSGYPRSSRSRAQLCMPLGVAPYMVFHISTTVMGSYVCWMIRVNVEEVGYEWHLGYLGAIRL
jgi:hypothetical protein